MISDCDIIKMTSLLQMNSQEIVLALALALALTLTPVVNACADTRPTEGSVGTVTLSFYQDKSGSSTRGKTGDPCPFECNDANFINKNTFYEKSKVPSSYPNGCTSWPGSSGENSMTDGTCDTANDKFTISQRITCDCSGTIEVKEAYSQKCVVDKPTTLCAKITKWDAATCNLGGAATPTTAATTPAPASNSSGVEAPGAAAAGLASIAIAGLTIA